MSNFIMGVNYWPRSSAMYMWQRLDLGEIREDMARIKGFGLDLVRFFLMWEAFQPQADTIDGTALRRLDQIMETIHNAGLRAMPTLFCGHMSGVNWLPTWALDPATPHGRFRTIAGGATSPYGIGDFYADPTLLAAQERLARAAGAVIAHHPALYAWDLGNEFSNLREPRRPEDAAAWSARLTSALLETSGVGSTGGTHGEDLERDRGIRPSSITKPWEFATMHGYPVYSWFSRGRMDADVVPYLYEVMQSCSGKRVLFTELGNPTCPPGKISPYDRVPLPGDPPIDAASVPKNAASYACLTEDEMAQYARAVIERLHKRGALGAMWWCWADYDPSLASSPPFDRAEHELYFGIIRSDGSQKPVADVLEEIAHELRAVMPPPAPITNEAEYYASLPQGIGTLYKEYCRDH